MKPLLTLSIGLALLSPPAMAKVLESKAVFDLEYASQLAITDKGDLVYFVRNRMDIDTDKQVGNIWSVDTRTQALRPVTTGLHYDFSPLLSPDQSRLAFISTRSGKPQLFIKWLDTGATAMISHLPEPPQGLSWSPDSKQLAFSMFVPDKPNRPVSFSGKPEGAEWADDAIYIDEVFYRQDGAGYNRPGAVQLFTLPAEGGNPRQLTFDKYDHQGKLSWTPDAAEIYFSANPRQASGLAPMNSEIFALKLSDASVRQITDRDGPDSTPQISPDGKLLAYLGFDDKKSNYENARLYIKPLAGGEARAITLDLDRSVDDMRWAANSKGLYIQYEDRGTNTLAYQPLSGERQLLTHEVGGTFLGRPYTSGSFALAKDGTLAFPLADPQRPADVAVLHGDEVKRLTRLNQDALGQTSLGKVEEIAFKSSVDGLNIQGWILYPPGFDGSKKYPLLLEIHGGPVAAYGPQFAAELQLYAARGYVVLYLNPRGSSSYGKDFAQQIYHQYPSKDFDDLMAGVDAVIAKGFIDERKVFVTGGSGGGTLTAWIVGHTDRFTAAVVAKPVINWFSFVLTADFYPFFSQYWFPQKPWEDPELYMKLSPISYVGNMRTPTMLLTGEADHRTPISESEQLYQALKLKGVDTAMVRIPNAGHGITARPSNLMAKVEYILWWFGKYGGPQAAEDAKADKDMSGKESL
ncbi:S9 family peptidase [Shewanella salipaludis]|uniref:S9 family peptidase n=1 Tax=Shewanella salipaludis TaxID=2723052 RepID=A0A972JK68_9GAMM|nr:S9 family peptidase [Shewanella salipaludis]NMH64042.1 S9 family peptidase [Shewanella salipaludis]